MAQGVVTVTGVADLSARLLALANEAGPKAGISGTRAALRELAKGIRAAINSTNAPSDIKRKARKSISHRYEKSKAWASHGRYRGRAGYAVGKPKGHKLGAHQSRGVGLSTRNIHWFVFGVEDFATAARHHKSGQSTGTMPAGGPPGFLAGTVQAGTQASAGAAFNAARIKIRDVIQREARKRRKGK